MFDFFAKIFGYVMSFIYENIGNFGFSIILFTILLRLVLLPFSIKQQKTMKKTAKIQEKVKEIQKKYSNDPVRMNQEVIDLYSAEKMSPFSGCLSSLLQIVVVIAVFYVVSKPLTYIMKLPEKTINEYKAEMSKEVGKNESYVEISIIKHLSNKYDNVNLNMDFLGLDLSDIPTQDYSDIKVFIIPVLYVITSILSTKIAMNSTKKDKKKKEIEAKKEDENLIKVEKEENEMEMVEAMNKNMMYMMPVMTVMIALIAPLGLALYWLVSNILMILERVVINKLVKED